MGNLKIFREKGENGVNSIFPEQFEEKGENGVNSIFPEQFGKKIGTFLILS